MKKTEYKNCVSNKLFYGSHQILKNMGNNLIPGIEFKLWQLSHESIASPLELQLAFFPNIFGKKYVLSLFKF